MTSVAPIAAAAARWWTDRLRYADGNAGPPEPGSLVELLINNVELPEPTERQFAVFEDQVARRINLAIETAQRTLRWPMRTYDAAPILTLVTDYGPEGILDDAATIAGIPGGHNFPWKTRTAIWTDENGVPAAITRRINSGPPEVLHAERIPVQPSAVTLWLSNDPHEYNPDLGGPTRLVAMRRMMTLLTAPGGLSEVAAEARIEARLRERFESRALRRREAGERLDSMDERMLLGIDFRRAAAEQRRIAVGPTGSGVAGL